MSTSREMSIKTSRSFIILYIFKFLFISFISVMRTYSCHSTHTEVRGQFAGFTSLPLANGLKG